MRLDDERESSNIEDRRRGFGGGAKLGIGGILLALAISYFTGIDPSTLLQVGEQVSSQIGTQRAATPPANDEMARFVSKVLASTEDTWTAIFQESQKTYRHPKLVLFSGSTPTACGQGRDAMGPFYCPADQRVYIDLAFYQELKTRFKAPGEFAEAYVIAHEVGHHVQHLLGVSERVQRARQQASSEAQANALSVRLELQADCFAGLWARRADDMRQIIEPGEVQQALTAAAAIGDDRLQQQSRGVIVPESFTHGTSQQRVRWFQRGMTSRSPRDCDTFSGPV